MFKRLKTKLDIENQLYLIQIFGIVVTAALCLVVMLTVTLSHSNQQQEEELLDECVTLARAKNVVSALQAGEGDEYLSNYLNIYIKSIPNLDFVAVCNTLNTCLYYPTRPLWGGPCVLAARTGFWRGRDLTLSPWSGPDTDWRWPMPRCGGRTALCWDT